VTQPTVFSASPLAPEGAFRLITNLQNVFELA
jgi:hypothetical protein